MAMETSTSGITRALFFSGLSSKKKCGNIPKRIHKAEREKMKRKHSNDLFLALANSLELSVQNSGKASVLIEATRAVKDMLVQIECLKKENVALLSESQYVTVEKSELKDETSALGAEIDKLRTKINSSGSQFQLDLNMAPPEYPNQELGLYSTDGPLVFPLSQHGLPQGQIVSPSHLATCIQGYPEVGMEKLASKHISFVSKPHAQYRTPADKWPSQVLEKQPKLRNGVHQGYRNNDYAGRLGN